MALEQMQVSARYGLELIEQYAEVDKRLKELQEEKGRLKKALLSQFNLADGEGEVEGLKHKIKVKQRITEVGPNKADLEKEFGREWWCERIKRLNVAQVVSVEVL